MKEKFYHAYLVDNNRRTIRPSYMTEAEVKRVASFGWLFDTPQPINFVDLDMPPTYHTTFELNDIYIAYAWNREFVK